MTMFVFAVLGGLIGLSLLSGGGVVFGAVVGALAGWVSDLAGRVRLLERRLEAARAAEGRALAEAQEARRAAAPPPATVGPSAAAEPVVPLPPPPPPAPEAPTAAVSEPPSPRAPERVSVSTVAGVRARRAAALAAQPSPFAELLSRAARWFTTGNVPVKVGVVLSVFGVGFLVKEGIDRQWLVLPLEWRLVLVALFGIGLLVLGWRLRTRQRVYALSVQGGGIAVLYLTIFASFELYQLLPGTLAFALLVLVTAGVGALAVLQDSRALAILGIVGGFMAPVLTSSGSGNHVALFTYYAILNVAIVGIAWFKAWRMLNVLGFVFTFGIATLWGYDAYRPELFASTEPFLVLFVLMYLLIPVLFATRQAPELRGFVDGTLVFGTPIVAFGLQSQLLANTQYGLALSAVALAAIYIVMATYLYRRRASELRVLVEAQFALSVAFVTVAIPLALDARWTSAAWALQGAALVWLGFRQRRKLAFAAGLALQALSAVAYVVQSGATAAWPIANGLYLGALLLALAGAFSARLFDPARERPDDELPLRDSFATLLAVVLLLWATGWWLFAGFAEIDRHVAGRFEFATELLFIAGTAWLALFAAARSGWPRLNWVGVTLWPLAVFGALLASFSVQHPAQDLGFIAWPVVIATMLGFLRVREALFSALRAALHTLTYWLAAALLLWETHWQVQQVAGGVWPVAAALALGAALVTATLRSRTQLAWPLAAHAGTYLRAGCGGLLCVLGAATLVANVVSPGDAAPLPYLPLVNPLELASVFVWLVLLEWWAAVAQHDEKLAALTPYRAAAAAVFGWFLVTMAVARAVHHWSGVPYELDSLAASTTLQSALSIVWGVSGLAAMLVGARARRRLVWLAGAGLMAVVVVKLFLVDLGNTATLARVVSFLGVGVLLLVVGYFAPVPPRAEADSRAAG
jgi:uncharacterized membrane protein